MTRLLTLGCSWVKAIGASYDNTKKYTRDEYRKFSFDNEQRKYSFTTLLCKKYKLDHVDISAGGAANNSQARKLKRYLLANDLNDTIVMWGITSIYRDEMYFTDTKKHHSFQPNQKVDLRKTGRSNWCGPKEHFNLHFDEEMAISLLTSDICHWQKHFELAGCEQMWFDTLNTITYAEYRGHSLHKPFCEMPYPCNKDLLSQLAYKNGWDPVDDKYHSSDWRADCDRIKLLEQKGVVNPYSFHPTRQGHEQIAEILDPIFEKYYNRHKSNNPNPSLYKTLWHKSYQVSNYDD